MMSFRKEGGRERKRERALSALTGSSPLSPNRLECYSFLRLVFYSFLRLGTILKMARNFKTLHTISTTTHNMQNTSDSLQNETPLLELYKNHSMCADMKHTIFM